ncbi:MAG: pilus assembly PilX N-terminal domain-containing protein [Victivallaceae bacterium]|nr:pilus assembly PilX N-terminal domain-containing protein [Victivallaceae bacterium]
MSQIITEIHVSSPRLMASSFARRGSDRGVALLFALGVLSALMLLGIAFINGSLFARRIAENRSHGAEAKLLARSVADLVAGAVDQMYQSGGTPGFDLRNVFSVGDPSATSRSQDAYGEFLRPYSRGGNSAYSKLDVYSRTPYHGSDSSAQWVYVHTPEVDDDGNRSAADSVIIGRYAYQVLPTPGFGRMSLYRVLTGSYVNQEQFPGNWDQNAAGSSYQTQVFGITPQDARWGQSILELKWRESGSPNAFGFQTADEIPTRFAEFYAGGYVSPSDREERAWLESSFTEDVFPGFREVAPGGGPRFNLTAWNSADPWYDRFGGVSVANSNTVVDKLLASGTQESLEFELDKDKSQAPGLAFLNSIGNGGETGSFQSVDDLRRQIAANLNDYCDGDDIPTSDVALTPDASPVYTGNERTLYLNELAYALSLNFVAESGQQISLDSATSTFNWFAELIDVYGNVDGNGNLDAAGYQLEGDFGSDFRCVVSLVPTFRVQNYSYTINGSDQPGSGSDYEWTPDVAADHTRYDDHVNRGINPGSFPAITNFSGNEYKVGMAGVALTPASPSPWDFGDSFWRDEVRQALIAKICADENVDASAVTIDSMSAPDLISMQAKFADLSLQTKNFVLKKSGDPVDFVNVNFSGSDRTIAIRNRTLGSASTSFRTIALIGGMEVKDPRQNLNVVTESRAPSGDEAGDFKDAAHSDWVWNPRVVIGPAVDLSAVTTMTGTFNGTAAPTDFQGALNSASAPDNPGSAGNTADHDRENVSNPGWTSASAGGHISTAVIRNAPMKSPWELGFIHRGIPFQTVNLKKAATSSDTRYSDGDGAIFDYIRMTQANYSYGRLNLNQFGTVATSGGLQSNENTIRYRGAGTNISTTSTQWGQLDNELLAALFEGVPATEDAADFVRLTADAQAGSYSAPGGRAGGDVGTMASNLRTQLLNDIPDAADRYDVASEVLNLTAGSTPLFVSWSGGDTAPDAQQELLAGRTMNLLTAGGEPPSVFRAVIVAQTIRDLGGDNGADITVVSSDHPDATPDRAWHGRFDMQGGHTDPNDNVHFDVITGEAKILVTYERDASTGRIVIRDIESID